MLAQSTTPTSFHMISGVMNNGKLGFLNHNLRPLDGAKCNYHVFLGVFLDTDVRDMDCINTNTTYLSQTFIWLVFDMQQRG